VLGDDFENDDVVDLRLGAEVAAKKIPDVKENIRCIGTSAIQPDESEAAVREFDDGALGHLSVCPQRPPTAPERAAQNESPAWPCTSKIPAGPNGAAEKQVANSVEPMQVGRDLSPSHSHPISMVTRFATMLLSSTLGCLVAEATADTDTEIVDERTA
jgi:hypothetical protein